MDGMDFRIQLPSVGIYGWHSQKINRSGFQYQFVFGIPNGELVHIEGPFPAAHWPDINIYHRTIKQMLLSGEKIFANFGYWGEKTVIIPNNAIEPEVLTLITLAQAHHDGINGLFKQ